MPNCEICPIIEHPTEADLPLRIHEDEFWQTTLRTDQEYLGSAYITAKRHVESLPELTAQEELSFIEARNQLIVAQQRAFGAAVVNVSCLMNLAFTPEGEGDPHVHYHLKPRYPYPVEAFGQVFIDRQFGKYITDKHPHEVSLETGFSIAEALRKHM